MGLQELQADARLVRERISKLTASQIDVKVELTDNILPLFEGMCEAIHEGLEREVADLGDAVDELLEQTEDVLHPETSGKIMDVLRVGALLSGELEKAAPKLNEVDRKRAKALIQAFRHGLTAVAEIIAEITLVDDPDEPADVVAVAPENGNASAGDDDGDDEEDGDELDVLDGGEG